MTSKKVLLLLVLGLFACAKARTQQLSERADLFNESLQWSSIKAAAAFMSSQNKKTLVDQYAKEFQKYKITDYAIMDVGLDETKKVGTVLVEYNYYDNNTLETSYKQELQTWNFDSDQKNWVLKESRVISQPAQN